MKDPDYIPIEVSVHDVLRRLYYEETLMRATHSSAINVLYPTVDHYQRFQELIDLIRRLDDNP